MGNIISEGLQYIGSIDKYGYVYDQSGKRIAKVNDNGYIGKVGNGKVIGKIDEDGTIRDASLDVVGRVQADGYVYIHGKRVCQVTSAFIERITPKAWNAGEPSSYEGRQNYDAENTYNEAPGGGGFEWPFGVGTTLKLIVGVILGIGCIVTNASALGFGGCLIAVPVCVAMVFIGCFIIKLISGGYN